jgi:hypothetical protein
MTIDRPSSGKMLAGFFALVVALGLGFVLGRYDPARTSDRSPPAHSKAKVAVASTRPAVPQPSPASPSADVPGLLDLLQDALLPKRDNDNTPQEIDPVASYEDLMYAQPDLVDDGLKRLRPHTPGTTDLYALGFAGDGDENVFRNEVDFLPKLLAQRFDAQGRTLQLINSPQTFAKTPMATRTNLYQALGGIAQTMDRDNDVLLLFLTSHGSRDHQLFVQMGAMPLDQLMPEDIRDALDQAKIRWRVIVVSACFSGGFIPALREPHTMIITAARSDRTSFGCGNDSKITWFGKAFLTQALNHTTDFHAAYLEASRTIAQWEQRDHDTPSEPQFWEGPLIEAKLAAWRASLPPSTAQVPFAPASIASGAHRTKQ